MKSIAAFALTAIVAGPALAGGPTTVVPEPVVAIPAEPVLVPSADWSGFYAGGQLGYGDVDSNGGGLDGNGFLGGVHAGYRWDFGQYVAGAEIDYDAVDISLGRDAGSLDNVARLKLVGGAEVGNSLLYATTGLAYANASLGRASLSDDGWYYGAGVAVPVTDKLILGGELLQHNFNNFDGTGVDFNALTATARVSFRF